MDVGLFHVRLEMFVLQYTCDNVYEATSQVTCQRSIILAGESNARIIGGHPIYILC